ncbi:hypothetical protein PG991_007245 [Apiospora marii]|uniref:Uncharacterized protein n=1 Tax=Apiospora marii TaxID=335849 RepID=A0ABR1RSW8_9PEZI
MATSIHAGSGQLDDDDHTLQREAAYATASEVDSDYSTQQPTSSLSSAISSRSSLSAVSRIAQHIKPKAPAKRDTQALKSFDIAPEQKILDRFAIVQALIEEPLLKYLSISGTKQYSMSIRLMVLGPSRAEAKPYMVILALQDQCKRIQKFVRKSTVRRIYQPPPDDPTTPYFELLVYGRPPERKNGEGEIVVYAPFADHDLSTLLFTYCGTPITIRHISGHEVRATLGGVIRVEENGITRLYGLTAGHVMEDNDGETSLPSIDDENERHGESWSDSDSCSDSDTGTDYSGNILIEADLLLRSKPSKEPLHEEPPTDPWSPTQSRRLGSIQRLSAKAIRGSENSSNEGPIGNLDWALIDMDSYAPNRLPSPYKARDIPSFDLRAQLPSTELDKKGRSIRAVMISGSEGSISGTISPWPSRLLLSPGTGFVDAMIINLDKNKEVADGDSGSWVVDEETLEVYGHIVAADAFGGGYIIPIEDTMSDIRRYLNATSVSLPSVADIESFPNGSPHLAPHLTGKLEITHQEPPSSPSFQATAKSTKDPSVPGSHGTSAPTALSQPQHHGLGKSKGKRSLLGNRLGKPNNWSDNSDDGYPDAETPSHSPPKPTPGSGKEKQETNVASSPLDSVLLPLNQLNILTPHPPPAPPRRVSQKEESNRDKHTHDSGYGSLSSSQASTGWRAGRFKAEHERDRANPRAFSKAIQAKDEEIAQANQKAFELLADNMQLNSERKTYQKEWQALYDEKQALQAHATALKVTIEQLSSDIDKLKNDNYNLKRRQGTDVTSGSDYTMPGGLADTRSGLPAGSKYAASSYVGSSSTSRSDRTANSGVSESGSMSTTPTQYTSSSYMGSVSSPSVDSRRLRRQDKSLKPAQDPLYEDTERSAGPRYNG